MECGKRRKSFTYSLVRFSLLYNPLAEQLIVYEGLIGYES